MPHPQSPKHFHGKDPVAALRDAETRLQASTMPSFVMLTNEELREAGMA